MGTWYLCKQAQAILSAAALCPKQCVPLAINEGSQLHHTTCVITNTARKALIILRASNAHQRFNQRSSPAYSR